MQRLRPIDTPTLHQEVQERLREYILVNRLKPDDGLPTEAQLADQLGVSRAAVREGLRSLESLGLIYSRRGEGRYVRSFTLDPIMQNLSYSLMFDAEDVRQMIDVREELEAGFIEHAIAVLDDEALAKLRSLCNEMRQHADSGETFLDIDLEFHATIYRGLGNRVLLKLLDIFCTIYKNLRDTSLLVVRNPLAEVDKHEKILQC